MLVAVAAATRDIATQDPSRRVPLVTAHGSVISSASNVGRELMKHGWSPATSTPTASQAACLADAAVRLEHTNGIPAIARWC